MIKLEDKTNVVEPDATNIYGALKDDAGAHDGTYADTQMLQDAMVFFERIMAKSGITPNDLPDNDVNGYQLYEALKKVTIGSSYTFLLSQSGTGAPTATVLGSNDIGSIVWTRSSTGNYSGTLVGAFPSASTWFTATFRTNLGYGYMFRVSDDVIQIRTSNTGGTPSDSVLSSTPLEIRVYG